MMDDELGGIERRYRSPVSDLKVTTRVPLEARALPNQAVRETMEEMCQNTTIVTGTDMTKEWTPRI